MHYHDIIIEAAGAKVERMPDKTRLGSFTVRVLASPAGEMTPEQATPVSYDDKALQAQVQALESRALDDAALRALGRTLAALLLPPTPEGALAGVRDLFAASLVRLPPEDGLRVRLRLPPQLAALPWEYLYVERAGGGDGMDGFVALDPRIALVRHEALAAAPVAPYAAGKLKIVVALASAPGFAQLDLSREKADLEAAFASQSAVEPVIIEDATLDEVQAAITGAGVFHFAGHGKFDQQMGDTPGSFVGRGLLAFDDVLADAEQVGINLRGAGVRLAVLGGCETGRRDGVNIWSGVAPALVKAELPAVVANQFTVRDDCAIAFSRHFYGALVGGLPVEQAVAAGRIAAYNADKTGRDWGAAVLYLRAANGVLFGGAADAGAKQQAAAAARAVIDVRTGDVAAGGQVLGANVGEIRQGALAVNVQVGAVSGSVTGATIGTMSGGSAEVKVETGDVQEGGSVSGGTISLL